MSARGRRYEILPRPIFLLFTRSSFPFPPLRTPATQLTFSSEQEFEDDVENWRGSISAVNQCGEHLLQEFPHYESGELKNSMSELGERWANITNR